MSLKEIIMSIRPWSLIISLISVSAGFAFAFYEGYSFNPLLYILTLVGAVCAQSAVNVINDYFDTIYGIDKPDTPTVKYRPHLVVQGIFKPIQLIYMTLGFIVIGMATAVVLFLLSRSLVLAFGALGILLIYAWSGPPFKLKYVGLAEFENFLVFGPVIVVASYYVQAGTISPLVLLASLPFGFSEAVVDFANNLRDIDFDKKANIKTIPTMLGKEKALKVYSALLFIPNVLVVLFVILGIFKPISLITLLSIPLALKLIKEFKKEVPLMADAKTSSHNTLFSFLLIISFILVVFI